MTDFSFLKIKQACLACWFVTVAEVEDVEDKQKPFLRRYAILPMLDRREWGSATPVTLGGLPSISARCGEYLTQFKPFER